MYFWQEVVIAGDGCSLLLTQRWLSPVFVTQMNIFSFPKPAEEKIYKKKTELFDFFIHRNTTMQVLSAETVKSLLKMRWNERK